jgi:uncharacterized membrane-anchored protein
MRFTALILMFLMPGFASAFDGEQSGPMKAKIGDLAEIDVPAGYRWIDKAHIEGFMKGLGNIPRETELGALIGDQDGDRGWFALFEFEDVGYIKDAASEKLDAEALIKSIKEGNASANEERKKRGYSTLDVLGWGKAPFYNPDTQRLEWSILAQDGAIQVVNYKSRILGRKGVMDVVLVCDASQVDKLLPDFQKRLEGYNFTVGEKYAEWKEGDKVAAIGLAALILGGVAAKTGLLTVIFKYMGKLVVLVFAAIAAGFKKVKDWLSGGEKKKPEGYVPLSSASHEPLSPSASANSANGPPPDAARRSEAQPTMDDPKA